MKWILCFILLSLGGFGGMLIERARHSHIYVKKDDWAILFWIPLLFMNALLTLFILEKVKK